MPITGGERHELHARPNVVLSEDEANILMEYLPPVGWADVTTKRDLDHVEVALPGDIESLASRMLRTQQIQLTVIVAAISALAAVLTVFG